MQTLVCPGGSSYFPNLTLPVPRIELVTFRIYIHSNNTPLYLIPGYWLDLSVEWGVFTSLTRPQEFTA